MILRVPEVKVLKVSILPTRFDPRDCQRWLPQVAQELSTRARYTMAKDHNNNNNNNNNKESFDSQSAIFCFLTGFLIIIYDECPPFGRCTATGRTAPKTISLTSNIFFWLPSNVDSVQVSSSCLFLSKELPKWRWTNLPPARVLFGCFWLLYK